MATDALGCWFCNGGWYWSTGLSIHYTRPSPVISKSKLSAFVLLPLDLYHFTSSTKSTLSFSIKKKANFGYQSIMPIKFSKQVSANLFRYVKTVDIKFNRKYKVLTWVLFLAKVVIWGCLSMRRFCHQGLHRPVVWPFFTFHFVTFLLSSYVTTL